MKSKKSIPQPVQRVGKDPISTFTVPVTWVPEQSVLSRLFNGKAEQPAERTFVIYRSVAGNAARMAERAVVLPAELKEGSLLETVMPLYNEHINDIIYIIAAAIQNNHLEPDQGLMAFLKRNLSADEIFAAFHASLEAIGLQSFLNCIVLAKGTIKIIKPDGEKEEITA